MSAFFNLPREIRDIIYHHVLQGCYYRPIKDRLHSPYGNVELWLVSDRLNILQTCRIIYAEAVKTLYWHHKFRFHLMSETLTTTLSQQAANFMQDIHIVLGSEVKQLQESLQLLQIFTGSSIMRKECRVELDMGHPIEAQVMVAAVSALKGFTGFKIVTVEMVVDGGNFYVWHNGSRYVQARRVWREIKVYLEESLGTAVHINGQNFRYLEFWPRQYLKQKELFSI